MRLYVGFEGGSLVDYGTQSYTGSTTLPNLKIGASAFSGEWLDGVVAGFKHYSAILTTTEMEAEFANYSPTRTSNLVRAHFRPNLANTSDYSGNNRTLSGGTGSTTENGPSSVLNGIVVSLPVVDLSVTPQAVTFEFQSTVNLPVVDVAVTPQAFQPIQRFVDLSTVDTTVTPQEAFPGRIFDLPCIDFEVTPLEARAAGVADVVDIDVVPLPLEVGFSIDNSAAQVGAYVSPPPQTIRFIAQSVLSKKFLHWDLPISDAEVSYVLSGPTIIRGRFNPEQLDMQNIGLEPWGTWIHMEDNGIIRASGILQPQKVSPFGEEISIEAFGPSAYPANMPFLGELSLINADPADIVRSIWAHLQSYPDAKLGVVVTGSTPERIGKPLPPPPPTAASGIIPDATQAAQLILDRLNLVPPLTTFEDWTWNGAPALVKTHNDTLIGEFKEEHPTASSLGDEAKTWLEGYIATHGPGTQQPDPATKDDKPYGLVWWEAPDCGQEIENLAKQTPFDFLERAEWNAAKTDVLHYIDLYYPRAGRRLIEPNDPRFIEGENMIHGVGPEEHPNQYASEVLLMGKGEGRTMVRGYAAKPSERGRVRRVHIMDRSMVGDVARANALSAEELVKRDAFMEIESVEIDGRHDNARLGTFRPGDDILVIARAPWTGLLRQWSRIVAYTFNTQTESVAVDIRRADAFQA
jgi:hypothetical protein